MNKKLRKNPLLGWMTPDQIKLILNQFFVLTTFLHKEIENKKFINWVNQKKLVDIYKLLYLVIEKELPLFWTEVWEKSKHIRQEHILEHKIDLINYIYRNSVKIFMLQNDEIF